MKKMKKFIIAGITILTLVAGSATAFASSQYTTPAEAVAGLTGRGVQSVIDEHNETGKTYGSIAKDEGVFDEFWPEILEMKKDTLAERVAAGSLTQEQADAMLARIEANQANLAKPGTGCGMGAGFRHGGGQGRGQGRRNGDRGMGNGLGKGRG